MKWGGLHLIGMQLALPGAGFAEYVCLQNMTFISQAALNGLVKTIKFTWFMESVNLTGKGLIFLSKFFLNNYTFPERPHR